MLDELRISGLGVIEDAVLALAPGFTVLTGETGAGKTMVLTGLGLLFGGRADPALVRPGAAQAVVEGRVCLPAGHPVLRRAAELGADLDDDGALVLSRSVSAQGRSRCQLGGRAVPLAVLAELGEQLLAVHGQSDQQRLLRPAEQRAALDRFAGEPVATLAARYREVFAQLRAASRELAELTSDALERAREADVLRHGLARIDALRPQPDEEQALAAETARLAHAETLREAAAQAHARLSAGPEAAPGQVDVQGLLGEAARHLRAAASYDPALQELAVRAEEAGYLLADLAGDLAGYAAGIETDPARLAALQQRAADLATLTRLYGQDARAVLDWAARARERLAVLEGDDGRRAELTAATGALAAELGRCAAQLTEGRTRAGRGFAAAVGAELAGLAMPRASLTVEVRHSEDPQGLPVGPRRLAFGPHGVDEVELLLAAHPGAPPRPLHRGASGGELSRVMLALEVVFAGADPVPTMVFDEVDAGVGGEAAVEVGRRLARLAASHQVLCVTHLPQVAAFADRHLAVGKGADGRVSRGGVRSVDGEARLRELARMLAGLTDSALGRAHAEELLAVAASGRRR